MTRFGFNHISVSCYCRGCYHIFRIGYNSCREYMGGDDRCPFCGTNEKVERDDAIDFRMLSYNGAEQFLRGHPRKLKAFKSDLEELKRIKRLLEEYGHKPGWYPPEDYPMISE